MTTELPMCYQLQIYFYKNFLFLYFYSQGFPICRKNIVWVHTLFHVLVLLCSTCEKSIVISSLFQSSIEKTVSVLLSAYIYSSLKVLLYIHKVAQTHQYGIVYPGRICSARSRYDKIYQIQSDSPPWYKHLIYNAWIMQ